MAGSVVGRPAVAYFEVTTELAPVSVNKLYFSHGQHRVLSAAGKTFKDMLAMAVADAVIRWCGRSIDTLVSMEGGRAELTILVYMAALRPKKRVKTKTGAASPYKKVDVTNYVKLIEDAVAQGTGIDDSANLDIHVHKAEDPENPRVCISYAIYSETP
jgi:Holliday junction resolvase RusA-like endonuclease